MNPVAPFYRPTLDVPPPPFTGRLHYRTKEGVDKMISAKEFFEITGACYASYTFPDRHFINTHPNKWVALKEHTSLYVPHPTDDNLRLVHIEGENAFVNLGLVARVALKRGQPICHYHGCMGVDEQKESDYQLDNVDAKEFRSYGAMVNHGFPNAALSRHSHQGVDELSVATLDAIQQDEVICVDYGRDYPKVAIGRHAEFRYEAAKKFVRHNPSIDKSFNDASKKAKWQYLAANPSVILDLYLRGDWSRAHIEQFLDDVVSRFTVPKYLEWVSYAFSIGFARSHDDLQLLKAKNPELFFVVQNGFHEISRDYSVDDAINLFRKFTVPSSSEEWAETLKHINLP